MGKTKYTAAVSAGSANPYAQQGNAGGMPQVPKASTSVGSPQKRANQRTPTAPAYLCVSKVCSEATIYTKDDGVCLFPGITGVNQSVYLVTLSHPNAYPQIDFKFVEKMDEMLRAKPEASSPQPRNWEELLKQSHVVSVTTGTFVPYNLPYKNWQRAFYVAGDAAGCLNFLMEIDNGIVHTVNHHTKPKYGAFPLQVQLAQNVGFTLQKGDFDYTAVEVIENVRTDALAVTPLNVQPPAGVRPLVVHFEVVSETEVAMTFFGDTYRHRHALETAGLDRTKEEEATPDAAAQTGGSDRAKRLETFYLMSSKDISVEAEATFVTSLLTVAVEHAIVDVRVVGVPVVDTVTHAFVASLQEFPNLLVHDA